MPLPHTAKLPVPKSEDEFEDLCVDALRIRWKVEPQRNGRRGQRQHGVDIFAEPTAGRFIAAQCKNMASIDLVAVWHEVTLARGFLPPLVDFVLVLSGPRDANLQRDVRVHYTANPEPFGVGVLFWDDVLNHIAMDQNVVNKYWPAWTSAPTAPSMGSASAPAVATASALCAASPSPISVTPAAPSPSAAAVDQAPEPTDSGARAPILAGLAEPPVAAPLRIVHVWPYSAPEPLLRNREVEARTLDALPAERSRDDLLLPRQLVGPTFGDSGVVWRECIEGHPALDRTLAVGNDGSVAFASTLWEAHHPQLAWGNDGVGVGSSMDVLVGTMSIARGLVRATGRTPRLWVTLTLHGGAGRRFVADRDPTSAAPLFPGARSQPIPSGFLRAAGQFDLAADAATITPMIVEMIENIVYKTRWRLPSGFAEQRIKRALALAEWK